MWRPFLTFLALHSSLLAFGSSLLFTRPTNEEMGRVRSTHDVRRETAFVELEPGKPRYLLVCGWGEKRTGGYSLRIESVTLSKGRLTVRVRTHSPARGVIVTQAFTYPADAVWLPAKRLSRIKAPPAAEMVDQEGKMLATSEAR